MEKNSIYIAIGYNENEIPKSIGKYKCKLVNKQKYDNFIDFFMSKAAVLGEEGQQIITEIFEFILNSNFKDFSLKDVHNIPHQGDLLLISDKMIFMIEIKNKSSISTDEDVNKFDNDIVNIEKEYKKHTIGIFLNIGSGKIPHHKDIEMNTKSVYLTREHITKSSIEMLLTFYINEYNKDVNKNISSYRFIEPLTDLETLDVNIDKNVEELTKTYNHLKKSIKYIQNNITNLKHQKEIINSIRNNYNKAKTEFENNNKVSNETNDNNKVSNEINDNNTNGISKQNDNVNKDDLNDISDEELDSLDSLSIPIKIINKAVDKDNNKAVDKANDKDNNKAVDKAVDKDNNKAVNNKDVNNKDVNNKDVDKDVNNKAVNNDVNNKAVDKDNNKAVNNKDVNNKAVNNKAVNNDVNNKAVDKDNNKAVNNKDVNNKDADNDIFDFDVSKNNVDAQSCYIPKQTNNKHISHKLFRQLLVDGITNQNSITKKMLTNKYPQYNIYVSTTSLDNIRKQYTEYKRSRK